ncbi:MAG: CBS domain-containing protein [Bryobacteraceae bacterium]
MDHLRKLLAAREMFPVERTETVADVARKMTQRNVGAILVLDRGALCGVFSERDLMRRVVVENRDPASTLVEEVMSRNLSVISDDATIEEAMQTMSRLGIRHLPVVRGSEALGMVSMRDLMDIELERRTLELEQMRSYIHGAA